MGFVRTLRGKLRLLALCAFAWAGCNLNPQPLPPDNGPTFGNGSSSTGAGGFGSSGNFGNSNSSSYGGGLGADGAASGDAATIVPPGADATDGSADVTGPEGRGDGEAGADAEVDGADGETDGGDADAQHPADVDADGYDGTGGHS